MTIGSPLPMFGRVAALLGLALVLLAAASADAQGAAVGRGLDCGPGCWVNQQALTYRAAPGERNDLAVRLDGTDFVFTDSPTVSIVAEAGCRADGGVTRCARGDAYSINLVTDDADDHVYVDPDLRRSVSVSARGLGGYEGDDVLIALDGESDQVSCGPGGRGRPGGFGGS